MLHIADWYITLVFFCGLLGLGVSAILIFAHKAESFPARLLAGFLTSVSLVALNNALMATPVYLKVPHAWRAVSFVSFLAPALSFLYVRAVLEQSYRFRRSDAWWFLPALLYVLSMLPFYVLPATRKLEIIAQIVADNSLIAREPESLLPPGWTILSRVLFGLGACAAQFVWLGSWKRRVLHGANTNAHNLGMMRWLYLFSAMVSTMYVLLLMGVVSHLSRVVNLWELVVLTISATILFICISLLARPAILYGLTGWLQEPERELEPLASLPENSEEKTPAAKKPSLTEEQGKAYRAMLESHFAENNPFCRPVYKVADLAKELKIPAYQLSAFINQEYGKNFNEFVNDHRVDYLYNLLKANPSYRQFTFEALSREAGFNSRNAFIASVKRKTGKTPSEYFDLKEAV